MKNMLLQICVFVGVALFSAGCGVLEGPVPTSNVDIVVGE